jgi:hypothetical protein
LTPIRQRCPDPTAHAGSGALGVLKTENQKSASLLVVVVKNLLAIMVVVVV